MNQKIYVRLHDLKEFPLFQSPFLQTIILVSRPSSDHVRTVKRGVKQSSNKATAMCTSAIK